MALASWHKNGCCPNREIRLLLGEKKERLEKIGFRVYYGIGVLMYWCIFVFLYLVLVSSCICVFVYLCFCVFVYFVHLCHFPRLK